MAWLQLDRKTIDPPLEQKSVSGSTTSFFDFLSAGSNNDLADFVAIQMYMDAMPFFNAVDIRARNFAAIPIRVWDNSKSEFLDDHPVLELLQNPNADTTQLEFLYQYSSYFDITGDSYLFAGGRVNAPPLEIATVPPQRTTFGFGNKFGILHVPDTITISTAGQGSSVFQATEVNGMIRFYEREDRELWHTRQFNPLRSSANFRGMSRAKPIFLEIQQYLSGNNTNWSMLKRGTRLSMAWVNNRGEALTEIQWSRMQEEAQKYAGDLNAGGTPILDGMDVKTIQQTNREMEFKDLQEAMLSRISTVYGIPLALLLDKSMTLNNLETSMLQLFDNAVIPLTNYLYAEMTQFLLRRYPDSENLEFKFNEGDITALRVRIIETAERQNKIGVNTINEIRTLIGDEALATGGDVVLVPANQIPVADDAFTDDNLNRPTASKFSELMREVKSKDGTRRYSESEIEKIAIDRGLI
ncbi:MAG: phage portal protein [Nitrosomonadaceae bacterium]